MKFLSDILAKAGLTVDGVVTLNNTATGQTPDANDNSTKLATTAWVRTFVQPYSLPIASASILGGIKVGTGLSIDSGTGILSVTGASASSLKSTQTFVVTEGQTVFTVTNGYSVGLIDIFLNGVYLSPNQSTATNGSTFTLNEAPATGDIIDVIVASPVYQGTSTTTDQLPEGVINLYYTNARARAAVSLTTTGVSGAATYNSSTGVFNIPNYQGLVPSGGIAGDILAKVDGTDYNTTWIPNFTSTVQHTVKAAVALTKGQAVYVSSADGTNMIVSKASNASEQTSSKTLGLVAQNLATNGQGFVVTEGLLAGLNTNGANAGDPVWLGTDGNLIFGLLNKPTAPAHLVFIGVVTRVQSNNGEIFVKVQNGFELDELHDLSVKNASDGDMIKYVASTGLWTKIAASTTNIVEGTNLYYTQGRFDTAFAAKSTTNLTEGTNLYYTDARVGTYLTNNSYATQTYVNTAVSNLVDAAPGTLDTLNELAAALGDDPNFATTVAASIGTKEPIITAGTTSQYWRGDKTWQTLPIYTLSGLGGQPQLNGTGFVKVSGTTVSYDNSTYLTTSSASSTYLPLSGGSLTGNLTFSTQGSKIIFGDSTSASPSMIGEGLVNTEGTDSDFLTIYFRNSLRVYSQTSEIGRFTSSGLRVYGSIIKDGGTSSQFLKADGSIDSNTYAVASSYLPLAGGNMTGQILFLSTSAPFSFQNNGNTGTYTQTTIYANQNNTSGSTANGIFIERGFTDTSNTEVRYFVIGSRGGGIQWRLDGAGNVVQTGSITASGTITSNTQLYVVNVPPATNGGLVNVRDSVTATNVTSFGGVFFNSSPGNDYSIGKLTENGSGFLQIRNANNGNELLRISNIGAATFTSTTGNGITIITNDVTTLKMRSSTGGTKSWGFATTNLAASDFGIYQSTSGGGDPITAGSPILYFSGAGAATFSSTIQATNIGIGNVPTGTKLFANQTSDGDWIATFKNYGGSASYGVSIDMSNSTSDQSALQVYTRAGNGIRVTAIGNLLVGTFTDIGGNLVVKRPYSSGYSTAYIGNTSFTAWNRQSYDTFVLQQDDVTSFRMVEKNGETTASDQVLTFSVGDGFARIASSAVPLQFFVNGSPSGLAYQGLSGTLALSIATSGAATFSSTITANGVANVITSVGLSGNANYLAFYESATRVGYIGKGSGGSYDFYFWNDQNANIRFGTNNTERLVIASTGAATFSSSVTATSGIIRGDLGTSVEASLRLRGSNSTARTTRLQFEDYAGAYADGLIDFKIGTAGVATTATLSIGVNGPGLTFNNTNVATFSSSIIANGDITISGYRVKDLSSTNRGVYIGNWGGAGYWGLGSTANAHELKLDQVSSTTGFWEGATDVNLYLGSNRLVLHSGNISSYALTSYTETDTLSTVVSRGNSTSSAIRIKRPTNKVDNSGATEFGGRVEYNNSFNAGASGYTIFYYPSDYVFRILADYDGNIGGAQPHFQIGYNYIHVNSRGSNIGYVGIGNDAPGYRLDVSGDIRATGVLNIVNDRNYYAKGSLRLTSSSNNASTLDISVTDSTTTIYSNYYSGGNDNNIIIGTYANLSNQLYLRNNGNIGINTTNPTTKFWMQQGVGTFACNTTGDSSINTATSSSLLLGPRGSRAGTGLYMAGISFDHLLNYSGVGDTTYSGIPHAWIGIRTVDLPGWERSALVFATRQDVNGTAGTTIERACVTPYGQLLINAQSSGYGTSGYGYNLGVRGNSSQVYMSLSLNNQTLDTQGLIIGIDTSYARFHARDNKGIMFANNDTERVLINTSGSIIASGDITAYGSPSDARLKTIKSKVTNATEKVSKLNGYHFDWNEVNDLAKIKEDVGVIAQEVADVFPELARTNEDGFMSVRYQGLTAVLIEAIKEQQTQIESQKTEIEELKDLVKQLINR